MRPEESSEIAVVLVNLGTPDAPTPQAVSRYLRQFLSDTRVIELPKLLWAVLLNALVIPLRRKRVAHAYEAIWADDSPMRSILRDQASQLETRLQQRFADRPVRVSVHPAMTYGAPALSDVLDQASARAVEQIIVLPMFPQYSATSSGAAMDGVTRWMRAQRNMPAVTILKDYFAHPRLIEALAESVRRYQAEHGVPDKLLMSFHGIPQPYADKGDPYARRCRCTAAQLAQALGLRGDQWAISFQSRFGKQEWVKPYTDATLKAWGEQGVESVQVISPAFSADCLETLEELAVENRQAFLQAGGKHYAYIPALNTDPLHLQLMEELIAPVVQGLVASQGG